MKRIGITQRVERIESYSETRDCLDQRWSDLVWQLGYIPIPLPNILPEHVSTEIIILDVKKNYPKKWDRNLSATD